MPILMTVIVKMLFLKNSMEQMKAMEVIDSSDEEIIINPQKARDSTSENVGDKRTVYVTKFGRKATNFHFSE